MLDLVIIFLLVLSSSIGILLLRRYFKKRDVGNERSPAALANQVLRYPERILIDVPLYISTVQKMSSYDLLLKAEAELATIGELQSRRQFLLRFAEVVNTPSKDSMKNLTDFLFHSAPVLFQETLLWDGRCNSAMRFLEFSSRLMESTEKGKKLRSKQMHSKHKKTRSAKKVPSDLKGIDITIIQEWNELNQAIHRTISSLSDKNNQIRDSKSTLGLQSLRLTEEDRVPHLIPILIAARDICQDVLLSMTHIK